MTPLMEVMLPALDHTQAEAALLAAVDGSDSGIRRGGPTLSVSRAYTSSRTARWHLTTQHRTLTADRASSGLHCSIGMYLWGERGGEGKGGEG